MKISITSENILDLRAAIEHRATWFALLIEAAEEAGLDPEFARTAITKCGHFHAQTKFPKTDDLEEFAEVFATDNVKGIFDADVDVTSKRLDIDFNYCPLVVAWEKLGISKEKQALLCDIAMDGDRGIFSDYDKFDFELEDGTIAGGKPDCRLHITKIEK
jgi:hypothetical protein